MLSLRQLDSIVQSNLRSFKGFNIENRREEGTYIFYDVYDNPESGKRFLGTYQVWEHHDGSARAGWVPIEIDDSEVERIRLKAWEAIVAIAVPANQPSEHLETLQTRIENEENKRLQLFLSEVDFDVVDAEIMSILERLDLEQGLSIKRIVVTPALIRYACPHEFQGLQLKRLPQQLEILETGPSPNEYPTNMTEVTKGYYQKHRDVVKTVFAELRKFEVAHPTNTITSVASPAVGTANIWSNDQGQVIFGGTANPGQTEKLLKSLAPLIPPKNGFQQPVHEVTTVEFNAGKISDTRRRGKSGRPKFPEDIWAWKQVNQHNRPMNEVYKEWIEKIKENSKRGYLADPKRQFNRIIKPAWGAKLGQN